MTNGNNTNAFMYIRMTLQSFGFRFDNRIQLYMGGIVIVFLLGFLALLIQSFSTKEDEKLYSPFIVALSFIDLYGIVRLIWFAHILCNVNQALRHHRIALVHHSAALQ